MQARSCFHFRVESSGVLQGPAGRRLLARCGRSPEDISSIVLVEPGGRHYVKSEAVLRIAQVRDKVKWWQVVSIEVAVISVNTIHTKITKILSMPTSTRNPEWSQAGGGAIVTL